MSALWGSDINNALYSIRLTLLSGRKTGHFGQENPPNWSFSQPSYRQPIGVDLVLHYRHIVGVNIECGLDRKRGLGNRHPRQYVVK